MQNSTAPFEKSVSKLHMHCFPSNNRISKWNLETYLKRISKFHQLIVFLLEKIYMKLGIRYFQKNFGPKSCIFIEDFITLLTRFNHLPPAPKFKVFRCILETHNSPQLRSPQPRLEKGFEIVEIFKKSLVLIRFDQI